MKSITPNQGAASAGASANVMRCVVIQNTLSDYNLPLFRVLQERGHLDLTIFHRNGRTVTRDVAGFRAVQFPPGAVSRWLGRKLGIATPSLAMLRQLRRDRPQIVAIDGLSSVGTAIALSLCFARGRPAKIWWSLGAVPERRMGWRTLLGDRLQRWCALRAGSVLAYGTHARDYFISLGVPPEAIIVGHNTIDERAALRPSADEVAALRQQLGWNGQRVILFCGALKPGKNIDLLLRAFARIVTLPDMTAPRLLLVGDGPLRAALEALALELGLMDKVRFAGEQKVHVARFFGLAEFCVLPGLGGLAINHAFAHGVPVVCGPADGTERDLVMPGRTGILLSVITVETLVAAIREMWLDPEGSRRMGAEGLRLISESYSLANYASRVEAAARLARSRLGN